MVVVVIVVVVSIFVLLFVESCLVSHLLLSPLEEFGISSLYWKDDGVWNWIVVGGWVVVVDVVNKSSDLAVGGDQLELVTSFFGGHSTELEVGSLEVALILIGLCNKSLVEKSFYESGSVLIVVNGQVNQSDSRVTGVWSACWLVVTLVEVLWNVGWSILLPRAWKSVLWLVLDFTGTTTVVSSLVVVVLVILIPTTHSVSVSSSEVTFSQII